MNDCFSCCWNLYFILPMESFLFITETIFCTFWNIFSHCLLQEGKRIRGVGRRVFIVTWWVKFSIYCGKKTLYLNSCCLDRCRHYFYWQANLSGWKRVINTLTQSADKAIIRLTPHVILTVSKPHYYLSVKNNSTKGNITDIFLKLKCYTAMNLSSNRLKT